MHNASEVCLLERMFCFCNDTATTEIYTYDTLFPYTTLFRSHLGKLRDWLEQLRGEPKLCAIGEIGLDYYVEDPDIERQHELLEAQLALAAEFELPVLDRKSVV